MTRLDAVCEDTLLAELGCERRGEEDLAGLTLAITKERVVGLAILMALSATTATCHEVEVATVLTWKFQSW
jgi:hypothetical protein